MTLQRGWNNKSKLLVVRLFPVDQFRKLKMQSTVQLFNHIIVWKVCYITFDFFDRFEEDV